MKKALSKISDIFVEILKNALMCALLCLIFLLPLLIAAITGNPDWMMLAVVSFLIDWCIITG
jgi:hypothetical protein